MPVIFSLVNTGNLLPHGFCINWTPALLWLYVISDALIVLAYYSIPISLAYFVRHRKDLQFSWVFKLFGAFILACGTTHLLGIVTLWNPIYWVDAGMKGITAVISLLTAVALVWQMPNALKLPTPAQLDKEVQARLHAYDVLKVTQASLTEANQSLESRVNERTQALHLQKNLYEMLSQTNQAIVRIKNRDELFQEICRIVVDIGKFNFVWVGMLDPVSQQVVPTYHYGNDAGYIDNLHISLKDSEYGPTAKAITTGQAVITNDFLSSNNTAPWHVAAKLAGVKGSGVFPIQLDGKIIGTLNIYTDELGYFTESMLPTLLEMSNDVSFALENFANEEVRRRQSEEKKRNEEKIQQYITQLQDAFMNTVEVAMNLSEMRDPYTSGHERRVAEIAVAISAELGFDANRQQGMRVAGYLHDIGKITIPAEILSKPGRLSDIEYTMIKGHAQASYDVLKNVDFPWPVAQVALQHHERIDGTGYPQGLKGEGIIIEARILAVADVVEAMSSHRPYRPGLGIDKALDEIKRGSGITYDVTVVNACLKLFNEKGYQLPC